MIQPKNDPKWTWTWDVGCVLWGALVAFYIVSLAYASELAERLLEYLQETQSRV